MAQFNGKESRCQCQIKTYSVEKISTSILWDCVIMYAGVFARNTLYENFRENSPRLEREDFIHGAFTARIG
jgi:hypothetical protein